MTYLLTKCLITDITAIWAPTSMCALCYHVILENEWHYTHLKNMEAHHCVHVDVLKGSFFKRMSYFTQHSTTGVKLYVCVGVSSCYYCEWKPYSTHYRTMGTHQNVNGGVIWGYSFEWLFYRTHHTNMSAHHYVNICALKGYPLKWKPYCTHHINKAAHHHVKVCVL